MTAISSIKAILAGLSTLWAVSEKDVLRVASLHEDAIIRPPLRQHSSASFLLPLVEGSTSMGRTVFVFRKHRLVEVDISLECGENTMRCVTEWDGVVSHLRNYGARVEAIPGCADVRNASDASFAIFDAHELIVRRKSDDDFVRKVEGMTRLSCEGKQWTFPQPKQRGQ